MAAVTDDAATVREYIQTYGPFIDAPSITEAALAALERLVAERDAAHKNEQEAIDALQNLAADHYFDALSQMKARAEAAEAERDSVIMAQQAINAQNERLREALAKIKHVVEDYPARPTYACLTATEIAANALNSRAALGETT